ncbi:MAG: TonB family protein [Bryobacteraceae bacterium]|nr:TonB family protein [Bryobacteraceae bacterium]
MWPVLLSVAAATSRAQTPDVLRGLTAVRVTMNIDETLKRHGLSEATLKADVELKLRLAGLTVSESAREFLSLTVSSADLGHIGIQGFAYSISIGLHERAYPARRLLDLYDTLIPACTDGVDKGSKAEKQQAGTVVRCDHKLLMELARTFYESDFVVTWYGPKIFGCVEKERIGTLVDSLKNSVDKFTSAWLAANSKPASVPPQSVAESSVRSAAASGPASTTAGPETKTASPPGLQASTSGPSTKLAPQLPSGASVPVLTWKVEPEYSEEARVSGLEGTVVIGFIIDPQGRPRDLRVIQGLGMGLDESALRAVSQWRFRPAYKDGKPVAVPATAEVNFRLLKR